MLVPALTCATCRNAFIEGSLGLGKLLLGVVDLRGYSLSRLRSTFNNRSVVLIDEVALWLRFVIKVCRKCTEAVCGLRLEPFRVPRC